MRCEQESETPMTTMKSKLHSFAAALLFLALSPAAAFAQQPGMPAGAVMLDPTTGLPVQPGPQWNEADWKATNWQDPGMVLPDVAYDNLPLSEVARSLRDQFKDQFDIILPGSTSAAAYVNGQMVPAEWRHDWPSESIHLHLKNVTASEIFGAMNLLFEDNRTPLRWELKVEGHRQIALLRVLVDPEPRDPPQLTPPPPPPVQRRIYFVGDLVGTEQTGGMSMQDIIKTITDVWTMADDGGGQIQFHQEAQLLVVSGSSSQIDFMEQTLKALRQKVEMMRRNANKTGEAHAGTPAGSGVAPEKKHE